MGLPNESEGYQEIKDPAVRLIESSADFSDIRGCAKRPGFLYHIWAG